MFAKFVGMLIDDAQLMSVVKFLCMYSYNRTTLFGISFVSYHPYAVLLFVYFVKITKSKQALLC